MLSKTEYLYIDINIYIHILYIYIRDTGRIWNGKVLANDTIFQLLQSCEGGFNGFHLDGKFTMMLMNLRGNPMQIHGSDSRCCSRNAKHEPYFQARTGLLEGDIDS